nr:uncharacterized protein LOC111419033 [Onthophagus taurus]
MSDLRNLSREFIVEFIELYRLHPCLWKTKDYVNKSLKNEAYKSLLERLQTIQPNATKNTVVQKINSLRGGFRREFKKMKEARRSGSGADDLYKPSLWYYNLMEFIKDQEMPRSSVCNVSDDGTNSRHNDDNNNANNQNKEQNLQTDREDEAHSTDDVVLGLHHLS